MKKRVKNVNQKIKNKKAGNKMVLAIKLILFFAILVSLVAAIRPVYLKHAKKDQPIAVATEEKYIYTAFLLEIYDKIKENYWESISDEQLSGLYRAGVEKILESPQVLQTNDKAGVRLIINSAFGNMEEDKQKEFTLNLGQIVLANLQPFGRSGLYSIKDEENLRDTVANIDKGINLYKELEVGEASSSEELKMAYIEKSDMLEAIINDDSQGQEQRQQAKEKKIMVERAYETLVDENKRENYDTAGIESTVSYKLIRPDIFYLHLKKMSPTTFEEFQSAIATVDEGDELDTLILDIRGNVGGAIDLMQWFLGPFIGLDQYAYEFYHRGEKEPFKTKIGWLPSLVRYKKTVVLIDGDTQSSAEIMAATLKKYNVGLLVGVPSKGWGTVENTFALDTRIDDQEKYSLLLVHSVTLRDDGLPIEGRGVDPVININDPKWKEQLYDYIPYQELIRAVAETLAGNN